MRWGMVRRYMPADVESVLEIGAGLGSMGGLLAERLHYFGLEPDEAAFQVAVERTGGRVGNVTAEQFNGTADLVCAFEVIEHAEDDVTALSDWRQLSRRWLMLSTPADPTRFGPWDQLAGHFRRYSATSLSDALRSGGWEPRLIRRYGFPIGDWLDTARQAVGARRAKQVSEAEATASSARVLQPSSRLSYLTWAAAAPARMLQAPFPDRGHGYIALAELANRNAADFLSSSRPEDDAEEPTSSRSSPEPDLSRIEGVTTAWTNHA
jgi:SAM-dependent methyltransferase